MARKEKNCGPEDRDRGDHVALDPDARLVVSRVVGKRTERAAHASARLPPTHAGTGDAADGIRPVPGVRAGDPRHVRQTGVTAQDRSPGISWNPRAALAYASVHTKRNSNRVVFGTAAAVAQGLMASAVSTVVNTCFVERHNGTDRNRCSREARKSYAFSKDGDTHRAATAFSYNFCWPFLPLCVKGEDGRYRARTRQWPPGSPITCGHTPNGWFIPPRNVRGAPPIAVHG